MDFALKILGKYGWKEGEGLGKNSNGIAKPLKATLKFDNAGFGADQAAADFNNHWWERVFNEAANNVDVKKDGETIKMDLKDDEEGVEISTKGYSMKKLKKAKRQREMDNANGYDNFLQAATLTNLGGEVENPNKIDPNDIEVTKIKVLTDEELFMACGGRTAHKGARHGLKSSGKLSRIEQQEEELLAKMLANRKGIEDANKIAKEKLKQKEKMENLEQDTVQKSKKKKKNDKQLEDSDVKKPVEECLADQLNENNELKKKKKKRKHCDNNFEENSTSMETIEDKKIKKSKKNNVPEVEAETSTDLTIQAEPKKKKKKNRETIVLENIEHTEPASIEDSNETTTKTKKKKKKGSANHDQE